MTGVRWPELVVRPLLVGLMFGALVYALVDLLELLAPGWNGFYLVPFCALVAMEAQYSHGWLRSRIVRLGGTLRYRLLELFVLWLLLQIVTNLAEGRGNPLYGIPRTDTGMVYAFGVVLLTWLGATNTAGDLHALGEEPEHNNEYVPPDQRLTSRFLVGGVLLLFTTGISRIGIAALMQLSHPPVTGLVLNVLVYYVLGVVMLGQMRYSVLSKTWSGRGARVAEGLAGRWLRYSAAFFGAVALIAFVLPTGYTVGLLDVLAFALNVVMAVLSLLAGLVWLLLALPFRLLAGLFGNGEAAPNPRFAPPPLPTPPPQATVGGDWLGLLRSIGFWLVVLGATVWLVRLYLRQHPGVRRALAGLGPLSWVRRLSVALWRGIRGYAEIVAERLPRDLLRRVTGRAGGGGPSFGFRGEPLTPREQVLYQYRKVLRRAGGQGLGRRQTQTPYEYDSTLGPALPSAREELGDLTSLFVEARYSPHDVDPAQAGQAREEARRVEEALEEARRRAEAEREERRGQRPA